MEDPHPDHQILLLLSAMVEKKTLVRHLYNIAPSFKKARSLIKGSRVCASLMMRFTDQ